MYKNSNPHFWEGRIHIPYNNDIGLVEAVAAIGLKNDIFFYFAPSPELSGTGRRLPNYALFFEDNKFSTEKFEKHMLQFLMLCKEKGFRTNLLLNNVLLGMPYSNADLKEKIPKIQRYLEEMDKQDLVSLITIGNPYLLELLNLKKLKNIKIKTSVNLQIKSEKSVDMLNVLAKTFYSGNIEEVEIQKDLLRNIPLLKKIRERLDPKTKLSILINEGCLKDCPYQQAHQIHSCNFPTDQLPEYDKDFKFGIAKCKYVTVIEKWRFLDANWILPEQVDYYNGVVDSMKITGRDDPTQKIIETIKAFTQGQYNRNNILTIISLMKMEDWIFPFSLLPEDFDRVLFGEDIPNAYYMKLFEDIKQYNESILKNVNIKLKGFSTNRLHEYEGVL